MSEAAPVLSTALRLEFTWVRVKSLALSAVSSPHTRRSYDRALTKFHGWYRPAEHGPFSSTVVQEYRAELERQGLAPSSINLELAALRKLASEAAAMRLLSPDAAVAISKVPRARRASVRATTSLTQAQAQQLLLLPNATTVKGKRDQALLALLLGCGLRRSELAALTIQQIEQRDGRWVIVDVVGKGGCVRSVPMPGWAKAAVDRWTSAAGLSNGGLLRPVNKADALSGDRVTAQSVFEIVGHYGQRLGIPVGPDDLRRTFAKLAYRGHAPLEQIQLSLGHASVHTTERYLGLEQDLVDAPCDHLGLHL